MTTAALGGGLTFVHPSFDEAPPAGDRSEAAIDNEPMAHVLLENAAEAVVRAEDALESNPETPAAPASTYVYGFEGAFSATGGALSQSEILLWLQSHSSDLNDQLRKRMYEADQRNQLVEDLSYLKAQVTDTADGQALLDQARELMAAYENTPFAEETRKALSGILENGDTIYDKDELSTTNDKLQSAIDKFGKDDQMDMIYIQELTSRLNEIFGLGSNIVASSHDTMKAIIGNLGR